MDRTLGEVLTEKIASSGKSKAWVASQLDVSERTIENYMKGTRSPKPEGLIKLGQILNFEIVDFVPLVPLEKTKEVKAHKDIYKGGNQYLRLLEDNIDLRKRINGLEEKLNQVLSNYDALQETLSFADAKQRKSLELIAGHLTGENKLKKAQEFLDTYDNVPFSLAEKKRIAGTQSGAGKGSKG